METLFIYFLKSSGLIAMFYLAYFILLRKETFFNSNRWFLLAGLFTAALLPLVVFTKIVWVNPSPTTFNWSNIPRTTTIENESFEINWYLVLGIVYLIGILMLLIKFAFDFYSLSQVLKGKTIQKQADFKFIDVTENIAPFSYFNSIVYNSSLYTATELKNILEHEKIHSEQNHTADVLISRLFCILFWFHPLVWLYKKAIIQNLEFIADSEASKKTSDIKVYQLTLLKITTQENCVAITNHFYQSLIKKRIVMLNKNQSKKRNSWKYAVVLPALIAFVFLFQIEVVAQEKTTLKQETEVKEAIDLTTFKIEKDLNALSKGKEIYVDGEKVNEEKLDKINPNDIKSIDIIKKSNKSVIVVTTKNVSNELTKPIKITDKDIYIDGVKSTNEEFNKLDQSTVDKVDVNTYENTVRIITKNQKPIIIVDGSPTNSNFKIEDIPTHQIESMNVLKGKSAIEKYGSEGKNGAIEITTKNRIYDFKKNENEPNNALIIINGEKAGSEIKMDNINEKAIKRIDVLKGKTAINKYGKEGENGVIEITTDKPDQILTKVTIGHPIPDVPPVQAIPPTPPADKKETKRDKSEIEFTRNEIVSSKKQWLETYKAIWKARLSLKELYFQKDQVKVDPKEITFINFQKFSDASQKVKDEKVKE